MSRKRNADLEPLDLTLWGISDTEVLAIVDDVRDDEGWSRTYDVRLQMGENPEETGRRSGVPPRLSWLKRYGWLERHDDGRWRLTPMGHAILDSPDLTRTVENALAKLNPAQRVRLTRELAEGANNGQLEVRTALRRQWQRSLGR